MNHSVKKHILPTIVIAQFCCTSLWFASNGIMDDLAATFSLNESAVSTLTTAVQFGFIIGTLLFAILNIADRFPPSLVFLSCAVLGAVTNLGLIYDGHGLGSLTLLRFVTGFFLAGIYPVGMKIASDYYNKGLGLSLGFLVGALVLGTGFPHALNALQFSGNWHFVIGATTGLAALGGIMMWLLVPVGPHRIPGQQIELSAFFQVFRSKNFRSAAFGYFGHMWELYSFWAFLPMILMYFQLKTGNEFSVSLWSFIIIAGGFFACVLGGYLSIRFGEKNVARTALALSGICCLLLPLAIVQPLKGLFLTFMIFWGMTVIADSPLFSTLVARNAPSDIKGTALTIVNSLGFAITIISIQLIGWLYNHSQDPFTFMLLAIGPIVGLLFLRKPTQINRS